MKKIMCIMGLMFIGSILMAEERILIITQRITVDSDNNYVSGVIESATLNIIDSDCSMQKRVTQENVDIPTDLLSKTHQDALETIVNVLDNK